jgi:PAS domain S-box-containing protein
MSPEALPPERDQDQKEILRLDLDRQRIATLYKALSHANKAIVHATDEAGLYQQVCRVCTEFLHIDLVFVSRVDTTGDHLEVVTASGRLTGYLDGIGINFDPKAPGGLDPSGRCLGGMGEQIHEDWNLELDLDPWRERAVAFGIRSSATFALSCEDRVVSALNLYSAEPGFFTADLLDLLREISGDTSFALDRFAREGHRQEAEEAFRATFEQAAVGITHVSLEGQFLKLNPRFAEMLGYPEQELLGLREQDLTDPEDQAEDAREMQALVAGTRPSSCWEKRYLRKEGGPIWVRVTLALLHDLGGAPTYFVNVIEDLTSQRAAAAQHEELLESLHQAQKMESLGTLSAGIAHDMNNVLAGIMGTAEVMNVTCDPASDEARYIATIIRSSKRGRDLVMNLSAFARKGLKEALLLNLNELVSNEIDLLRRTTLQKVEVHSDLDPKLPPIMGEASAIASALMNLCVNAVNAMPEGGLLTIRTARLPDHWVQLVVTDNGQGMSPEVLAKAMEPFFTTKPVGKGTGLGLTIAFAVLKAHGGTLDIRSDLGKGTTVTMRFPGASGEVALPEPRSTPDEVAQHRISVLIVDDDNEFLEIIPRLVTSLGHATNTACRGQEALDRLGSGLEVDLVILDQNMPGLSGTETLRQLRERWPMLPVILGTGYLDSSAVAQVAGYERVQILHKPYGRQELREAIDQIMATGMVLAPDQKPLAP